MPGSAQRGAVARGAVYPPLGGYFWCLALDATLSTALARIKNILKNY